MKKMPRMATITMLMLLSVPLLINSTAMIKDRSLADAGYGTHMAPLITAIAHTNGPVLEMGAGDFSTPLLHAVCSAAQRQLLTTDTDEKWLKLFYDLQTPWHTFMYVPVYEDDYQKNPKPNRWDDVGNNQQWSVVFIDHRPGERRIIDVQRLRKNTDIFVIHDTEQRTYGYEPYLSTFKYKYVYKRYSTQTTLVSDATDVRKFFSDESDFVLSPEKRNKWQWLDDDGTVFPWYTKPFLEVLKTWDIHNWDILEWGSGYSTIWFARKCKSVTSIDHNSEWSDAVAAYLNKLNLNNVTLKLRSPDPVATIGKCLPDCSYVTSIDEDNKLYDCIIIDGEYCRNTCAQKILKHIRPSGIIILDNANQASVGLDSTSMFELLKKYPHFSFKQPNHQDWRTDYWVIK